MAYYNMGCLCGDSGCGCNGLGDIFDDAAEAAVEAAARWRYEPAMRAGRPLPFPITASIRFTAD